MLNISRAMNFFNQVAAATTLAAVMLALVPVAAFANELPPEGPAEQLVAQVDETAKKPKDEPKPEKKVSICHANESNEQANNPFSVKSVDESGLNGHGDHTDDIIPNTPDLPGGKNLATSYPQFGGLTGAEILAAGCDPFKLLGDVKVIKVVSGGLAKVSDFKLFVGSTEVTSGVVKQNIKVGQYTVSETGTPVGYSATFSGDCNAQGLISVNDKDLKVCTITNTFIDADQDGITDTLDNCPLVANPDQLDTDGDQVGDACEAPVDTDQDTIPDIRDNCPLVPNLDQLDTDNDGIGDACEDAPVCTDKDANNVGKPLPCTYDPICRMGDNLLLNGSFETPTVTGDWGIFNPVANWMISLSDGLELWSNGFYGGASEGEQNAELDGNAPTKITQTVTTVPGATYELRFDFSARPDADSAANNSVDAYVGNVFLMNATADGSDIAVNTWSEHAKTFVATATSTDISFEDKGTADSYGSLIDNAVLCLVAPAPQCLPELNGSWADEVTSFDQGTRKDGSPVLVARSDEADALGMADWTPGEGVDFLSLGFGGSIVLTFGPFVPDVPGNDITVFEATNGAYPAETALVEVSQNGTTWYVLGTSTNPGASSFDLAGTGLTWVKYVRLTDTSNPAAHTNDADGFDLDAVFVTKTVCEAPADPTPKTCSIVSDTTTLVDGLPSTLTWVHPNWTDELTSGEWIWDATVEATNGETATFTKTFMVDNAATGATLKVAADNRYTATLNGNPLTCDGTPADNFSAADTCAAPVVVGLNTLTFVVTNDPYATVDVQTNPSGLIFELTIDGATCSPVIPPTPTGDTYKIQGYVWHDDNQNTNWDGMEESLIEVPAESPLAGWEVRITKGTTTYATTTDADGYYYFEVPAGTWVITEVVQSGWLRTTVESHTVTVPAEMADARSAFMEWLIPTAEAAVIGLPYGDYNFGNDTETVITTTPDSSSRSSGGSSGSRPRGRVAGLSDSTPMPMVLGEQVSAIPAGAPSTGRGGAAPINAVDSLLQLIGTSRRLQVLK